MRGRLRRCVATVVLSDLDWEVLRAVPQPAANELGPWVRCELSAEHRGWHHALAQGDAAGRDWWMRWSDGASIHGRDLAILLPCAAATIAEADPCLLFAGHAGSHSFQIAHHDLHPDSNPRCAGGESGAATTLAGCLAAHRLTMRMAGYLRELGTLEQVCGLRSTTHRGLTTVALAPQLVCADVYTPGLVPALIDDLARVPVPLPYAPPLGSLTPETSVPIELTPAGRSVLAELAPFWLS